MKAGSLRSGALLGLSLEPGKLSCAMVQVRGGRAQVKKTLEAPLALDPLSDDPALVGREIRNRLSAAGIRARRCALALPARWVLTLRTPLPALAPADEANYLALAAERGFPYAPKDLFWAVSRFSPAKGELEATLVAIPANHLAVIERVLRAARLKPVTITVGATLLLPPLDDGGGHAVALVLSETALDLAVGAGGGLVALRALGVEHAGIGEAAPSVDAIVRELRITLGQAPTDLRERIDTLYLCGSPAIVDDLGDALRAGVARLGLTLNVGAPPVADGQAWSREPVAPTAAAAAAQYLLGRPPLIELLPPRPSRLAQWTGRLSTRSTVFWAGAAAALAVVAGLAFFVQHWRLSRLERQWSAIAPQAEKLGALQETMRQVRPWFDDSAPSLVALSALTEAFPQTGEVWTKTVSIKGSVVTCEGNARSNDAWLGMLARLQATAGVQDLQVREVRGDSPLQFKFSFRWSPGDEHGA